MKNVPAYYKQAPLQITRTDMQKVVSYLNDASRLCDALTMQSMKSRAHMIRQLVAKLQKIQANAKN